MKTVLVEDEGAALRRLEGLSSNYPYINVVGTAKSGAEAINVINSKKPELILLDIELKDMNAFEVLQKLDKNYSGQIIFITAFNKYAIEAFNLAATDYLLKPYDDIRFDKAIKRALKRNEKTDIASLLELFANSNLNSNVQKLTIVEGTNVHYFDPNDIIWIEAEGYYSCIHKKDGSKLLIRKILKELDGILKGSVFKRINRSAIINTDHIERESKTIAQTYIYLKGGVKLKKSDYYSQ